MKRLMEFNMKVTRMQLRRLIERQIVEPTLAQQAQFDAEREASKPKQYTAEEYKTARQIAHQHIEKYKAAGQSPQALSERNGSILDLPHEVPQKRMHAQHAIETVMTMDTDSLINVYLGPMVEKSFLSTQVSYLLMDIVGPDVTEVLRSQIANEMLPSAPGSSNPYRKIKMTKKEAPSHATGFEDYQTYTLSGEVRVARFDVGSYSEGDYPYLDIGKGRVGLGLRDGTEDYEQTYLKSLVGKDVTVTGEYMNGTIYIDSKSDITTIKQGGESALNESRRRLKYRGF
jgi:hypothetical protein